MPESNVTEFHVPAHVGTTVVLNEGQVAKIDAALATQGEQLDRAKILEDTTLPNPSVKAVVEAKQFAADIVYPAAAPTVDTVTREEYVELKAQINDSFGEIAGILLDLQARNERLDERIELFNRRGGHKF